MAPELTEISSTTGQHTRSHPEHSADKEEFDNIVKGLAPTQLLVVDFHAVCHVDLHLRLEASLISRPGVDHAIISRLSLLNSPVE